ncbi:MAG TPA: DUF1801 domain-containing protein [Candidatus Limnocylindrales bacterium]|nr:DUF1801 domain-containing protein [Candidatus Limnocylindrales bacterium]
MAATKTTGKAPSDGRGGGVWSAEEKAAMRESAQERKRSTKMTPEEERAQGLADIQAKIDAMPDHDRALATRVHQLVLSAAPDLMPKTYYGMPAYARDGKNVCFFQPASKFKVRYSTLGFEQGARLDDGSMWPIAYALLDLTPADEKRITELVKRAAG